MRFHEIIREEQLDEIDRRGFLRGLGAAALAGTAGAAAARVTPGEDPNINRLTGRPNTAPSTNDEPRGNGGTIPNQNLETAERVERTADGIVIQHNGKEYQAFEVPKDAPIPRGAKVIKVQQSQLGIRGIGNYTTYLLPSGKAYIYSK